MNNWPPRLNTQRVPGSTGQAKRRKIRKDDKISHRPTPNSELRTAGRPTQTFIRRTSPNKKVSSLREKTEIRRPVRLWRITQIDADEGKWGRRGKRGKRRFGDLRILLVGRRKER
jgi:hypothetical protein